MRHFLERVLQFFLPGQCGCCQDFLEEGETGICSRCLSQIRWMAPPFCTTCGTPFVSIEAGCHPCGVCMTRSRHFTEARALGYYEGPLQQMIHRWKYEGKGQLTPLFGRWMVEGMTRWWGSEGHELLIPVPLHVKRLRQRGFNQALLLVKEMSRCTGIPYEMRVLRKKKGTLPQASLTGREREKEVRGAFHLAAEEKLEGRRVILVDDVYTTGATVNECSKLLLAGGVARVDVLTLARTVKKSHSLA